MVPLYHRRPKIRSRSCQLRADTEPRPNPSYPNKMAANQKQLYTIAEHELMEMSTAMPSFYGCKEKNDLTIGDFLDRFDKAARTSKWITYERKIEELSSLFRVAAND